MSRQYLLTHSHIGHIVSALCTINYQLSTALNPIQLYKSYFASIANKHTAILSNTEGGGSFGIENLGDIVEGAFRTRVGDNLFAFVLLNPILHPQTSGDGFDGVLEGGFLIMKGGLGRDSVASDITAAYEPCFNIATDMLLRMQDDSRNGNSFFNHGLDAISQGSVDMEEMAFNHAVDGTFVGVKVVFSFIVPFIQCSGISNSKWTDK